MDLLGGGGEGHVLLGRGAHVELVRLCQELPGHGRVCGGGVVRHTVQPAVPGGGRGGGDGVDCIRVGLRDYNYQFYFIE